MTFNELLQSSMKRNVGDMGHDILHCIVRSNLKESEHLTIILIPDLTTCINFEKNTADVISHLTV